MARQMAESRYREDQWTRRYDGHIAPINHLVDVLCQDPERGWVPYVAPMYGGTGARLLSLLRDPGPKTQEGKGSGFLSMENDDATAEAICNYFGQAGVSADDVIPWNAYPWYINRKPSPDELEAGIGPLKRLVDLLPMLRVVMLHGGDAKDVWKRFTRKHPNLVRDRQLYIIPTYHTSRQAFRHSDPAVRETRRVHLRDSFSEAARILIAGLDANQ